MKTKIAIVTDVSLFYNIFIPLLKKQNENVIVDVCGTIDEIDRKNNFESYNLILIDSGMTNMLCFEAIQHIRVLKHITVPIWFFAEIQTEEYTLKSMAMGVSRIIRKPYDPIKISTEMLSKQLIYSFD